MDKDIKTSNRPINKLQIFIGVVFLFIGVAVYLIDRPPDSTYFIYRFIPHLSLYNKIPGIFGPLGKSLPEFIHVFSFTLITAGIVSCGKRGALIISFGWLIINSLFELGQRYSSLALSLTPDWFSRIPILESTKGYFRGSFDYYDMIALFLGAISAYIVLVLTMERMD